MKAKKSIIMWGISLTVLGITIFALVFFLSKKYNPKLGNPAPINQLEHVKIKVDFVNSRRIALTVFFPLDYHMIVPGTYTLQRKNERNQWEDMKSPWRKELEDSLILTRSIDDEKYPNIGFVSEQFEFLDKYRSLEEGNYRVVFPVKVTAKEEEHLLAVPFQISREYEYDKEPKDYEYLVTTTSYTDLVEDYESCKTYITYDTFLSGFENYTFSRDMYEHLTKILLTVGEKSKEISDSAERKKLYSYFASAILSRADEGVFGGTFFRDMDWDTRPRALDIPNHIASSQQTLAVQFFFQYDEAEKYICCEISGHQMRLKTSDFAFDEEMVKSMPLGELLPVDDGEERVMEYYIFNDMEKALEKIVRNL